MNRVLESMLQILVLKIVEIDVGEVRIDPARIETLSSRPRRKDQFRRTLVVILQSEREKLSEVRKVCGYFCRTLKPSSRADS